MGARGDRPILSPSAIGQFFRLQSCPMYLQWEYDDDAQDRIDARDWSSASVSPVLTGEGDNFEFAQLEQLVEEADAVFGLEDTDTSDTAIEFTRTWEDDSDTGRDEVQSVIADVANSELGTTVIHQPHLAGQIGAYPVAGKADALLLEPTDDGLVPTLYEIKSSSEQRVHHRYQATIYAVLLEQYLDDIEEAAVPDSIPVKIITPENDLSGGDPDGFDTEPYQAKLALKLGDGGSFDQTILETDFEQTTNRIARRCSGCENRSSNGFRGYAISGKLSMAISYRDVRTLWTRNLFRGEISVS